jgi:hypothetical protein
VQVYAQELGNAPCDHADSFPWVCLLGRALCPSLQQGAFGLLPCPVDQLSDLTQTHITTLPSSYLLSQASDVLPVMSVVLLQLPFVQGRWSQRWKSLGPNQMWLMKGRTATAGAGTKSGTQGVPSGRTSLTAQRVGGMPGLPQLLPAIHALNTIQRRGLETVTSGI